MRKWIYYCGSWASLIGCLLVASGLESYTGWAMAGCFSGGAGAAGAGCGAGGPGQLRRAGRGRKARKERQPQKKQAASRRKAG